MTDDATRDELVEKAVEAALHARVPGGAEVWCWLPQKDAWTPSETARSVIESAVRAAIEAVGQQPSETAASPTIERLCELHRRFAERIELFGHVPASVEITLADADLLLDACTALNSQGTTTRIVAWLRNDAEFETTPSVLNEIADAIERREFLQGAGE